MADKVKELISNSKKQKYVICAILSFITIIIGISFMGFRSIRNITAETIYKGMSPLYISISLLIIILHLILCFYLKAQKRVAILRGLLMYQLIGVISFTLYFILRIISIPDNLIFPQYIFHWWSFFLKPLSFVISKFIHYVAFPYILGFLYVVLTYITGISLSGLIKNINFEKKIAEKKAFENESNKHNK